MVRYHIQRLTLVYGALCVICVVLAFVFCGHVFRYGRVYDLNAETAKHLQPGDFVRVTIDEFVVKRYHPQGGLSYSTFGYVGGLHDYEGYTIALRAPGECWRADGENALPQAYVQVLLRDFSTNWDLKDMFDRGQYHPDEPIVVIGRVEAHKFGLDWYRSWVIQNEGFSEDLLVKDMLIMQDDKIYYLNMLSSLLCMAFIFFIAACRSVDVLHSDEKIDERVQENGRLVYDAAYGLESSLKHEQRLLELLARKEKEYLFMARLGGGISLVSLLLLVGKVALSTFGMMYLLLFGYGLVQIAVWFVNSEYPLAIRIAGKLTIRSIPLQKCRILESMRIIQEKMQHIKEC